MLLQQTIRYFRLYPGDPFFLKAWVTFVTFMTYWDVDTNLCCVFV